MPDEHHHHVPPAHSSRQRRAAATGWVLSAHRLRTRSVQHQRKTGNAPRLRLRRGRLRGGEVDIVQRRVEPFWWDVPLVGLLVQPVEQVGAPLWQVEYPRSHTVGMQAEPQHVGRWGEKVGLDAGGEQVDRRANR